MPSAIPPVDPARLRQVAAEFGRPQAGRASFELLVTAIPFALLMAALFVAVDHEAWWALALCVPAGALLVRLFMIQHDCGHGIFFASRRANDIVGRIIGLLTLTPYAFWRRSHAVHHASSGNLERRGVGDVDTMTVREYLAASKWRRLGYRIYRHPLVIFGLGPTYIFLLRHRIPAGSIIKSREAWLSVLGTNLAMIAVGAAFAATLGLGTLLIGYLPVALIGASAGVWLFYVQHQYEETYWAHEGEWDFATAAWQGSSFYDLPAVLRWLTANIGFHHIHHLCARVPCYRLLECFRATPEFAQAKRLTLATSLRSARLALWDEDSRRLISFRELRTRFVAA